MKSNAILANELPFPQTAVLEVNGPELLDLLAAKKKKERCVDPVVPIRTTVDDRQNHMHKILEREEKYT